MTALTDSGKYTATEWIKVSRAFKIYQSNDIIGLGGTYQKTNVYPDGRVESNLQIQNGAQMRLDTIVHGIVEKQYLDNPFQRFHQSIQDYPDFQDDIDDVSLHQYDTWERLKPFEPKPGSTAGDSFVIPTEDNDQKLYFYDVQGESVFTNPPDPNQPTIDHGLDEEHIWAFNYTGYNQFVIKNPYAKSLWRSSQMLHLPFWGTKLITPSYYKEEKYVKFLKQWKIRLGLENIKMRHALEPSPDRHARQKMKEELEAYIGNAYEQLHADLLKDVYVTTHEAKQKKYFTTDVEDDSQFYRYTRALEDYNSAVSATPSKRTTRYEKGSLL